MIVVCQWSRIETPAARVAKVRRESAPRSPPYERASRGGHGQCGSERGRCRYACVMRVCLQSLCFSVPRAEQNASDADGMDVRLQLAAKEERIRVLEETLRQRDQEILNLRSHLDKFQSVFSLQQPLRPRKQRAQGISAEPQSPSSIQDFPIFPKDDRYVRGLGPYLSLPPCACVCVRCHFHPQRPRVTATSHAAERKGKEKNYK